MNVTMNVAERLADIKNQMQELKDQFHGFLGDTDMPLEDRWKAYCDNQELLNFSTWVDHSYEDDIGEILKLIMPEHYSGDLCWHSDMNVDRYQVVKYKNIITNLEEDNVAYDNGHRTSWVKSSQAEKLINELKERILAEANGGFTFDW